MDILKAKQEMKDFCYATDRNSNVVLSGLLHFEAKYLNKFKNALDKHDWEAATSYDELVNQAKNLYNEKVKEH